MDGDKLTLKGGHEFGSRQAMLLENACNLVRVGLALGATAQVDEAGVGTRKLQPFVSETRRPLRDCRQAVERRTVGCKLRYEQRGSFDGAH